MKRLILASNLLPVNISWQDEKYQIKKAEEQTISGLQNFYMAFEPRWVGLTGFENHDFTPEETEALESSLEPLSCVPIFARPRDRNLYLHGFSRNTIWPLFHYFTENVTYSEVSWKAYVKINRLFAEKILRIINDGDILWIHDYHLMLLPQMIRDQKPGISIGLFIHIPFPSFELFRLLPWRQEVIEGMLGADLIGFQIYDHVRHFMSSVRRLLGVDSVFNRISIGERTMKVDVFPKGIDYDRFRNRALSIHSHQVKPSVIQEEMKLFKESGQLEKLIISIDKLDYTKGIPQRIRAFERFLQTYPEYLGKVSLIVQAIPSGETSESFFNLKSKVDELVGRINGNYGSITWTPVRYMNQEFSMDERIDLYSLSDIALILPLRDGMNLVAKEFVASRHNGLGVLILSELAGASKELHEALLVNPNNLDDIAEAIRTAIEMPEEEQVRRNKVMMQRLQRYTVERWANEFMKNLEGVKEIQQVNLTRKINITRMKQIVVAYAETNRRILFLDYDGTLSWFTKDPEDARPDEQLYEILKELTRDDKNTVVIISGRDKETLGRWFDESWKIHFIAEHGVWLREPKGEWNMMEQIDNEWKESVQPLLEYYVDQTPRTFIEQKNFSLVWHYRKADPDLGMQRAWELKDELRTLTSNLNLEIMDGDKVLEIKYSGINKGRAALNMMGEIQYDFIFAVGDDWTDEYTFDAMPEGSYSIKVGTKTTKASYYIESVDGVRELLCRFRKEDWDGKPV
ncbi:MAG: bifunctional alpha,alpha-trehalose-phosphate synthase (UDP-forming)/trehalose-phosphatase [Bacteroidales bacterium]|nr:bifunctional alpha,alpha-trehalose-phosphate synthase (UDP-forming)/trehalose-phosphatase [Bacteroidales bacterium]